MPVIHPSSLAPLRGHLARKWHHLLLALGSAFVLLLLGSSQWQATASLQALAELRQQSAKVEYLDRLLFQLMDAENAVRGYLLSGNRDHLEPYEKSRDTANQTLEEIRRRLPPSPENDAALADLSGLVAIKLRSLGNAVERGIAGEDTRVQGMRYTDRIRENILTLKARLALQGEDSFRRSTRHVERSRWVVVTLAFGALALMTLLFLVLERQFKLREQIANLLQSENQRLDALVQERTDELSDLASYLTNAREAEKARLARELHDELGALLTAAKMEIGWITRHLDDPSPGPCQEHIARLEQRLDDGIALKRKIIDDLRPPLLEMLGLVSTLRALGEEFIAGDGENLCMELPADDIDLNPAPALALFRIAQEALTNIRKHARAHQAKLALHVIDGWLELEIDDDGEGFRTAWVRGRHHGLAGMKHRVQMCAGEFVVNSAPGMGTRIIARIPLLANQPAPPVAVQGEAASRT